MTTLRTRAFSSQAETPSFSQDAAKQSRYRRALRAALLVAPECAAIVCLLAIIWWGIASTLASQHDSAIDSAVRDTSNLAHAFEENTQRVVAGADQVLLALRAAYQRDPTQFDLRTWVRQESAPDWLTAQIAVIGADGLAIASTASNARVSVADRPHFLVQRDSTTDDLFISKPVIGRSSGRWTIQLTRKIIAPDGAFLGVVVLSIDCYQLSGFYESLNLQQGYIELFGLDGIVRARGPVQAGAIGATIDIADPTVDQLFQERSGIVNVPTGRDRVILAFRRLTAYPLVVLVAFNQKAILAPYRHTRFGMILSGLLATLVIIGLGRVWITQRNRSIAFQSSLELTLESMSQGLVMVDADDRVRVVNRRALDLLDLPSALLTTLRTRRSRKPTPHERDIIERLDPPHQLRHQGAKILQTHLAPIPTGGAVHTITDVTERDQADRRIRHMALHDHLTDLGNRVLLNEEADRLFDHPPQEGAAFGVLCLDLNGFKRVNDTLGHDVGDKLLIAVAQRLRDSVAPSDLAARTGGDEFAVLLRNIDQPGAGLETANRILKALQAPFVIAGQKLRIGACIGIATFPADGAAWTELLRNADLALYAAKSDRKQPIRTFEPAMAESARHRQQLEEDLRVAIGTEQIHIDYQPQFRTSNLAVVGFEALVRWNHPIRGRLRPDIFIPLAEETGLIVPLGRQVLQTACCAALRWPEGTHIAVNISPVQFRDPHIVETVAAVLADTGLPASRLHLEVTEGVLIADEQQALETMDKLRALGVALSLDDFGTGYASLSYLRKFPFEQIKLDRSFVQAQVLEERSRHILRAILSLSRNLHLSVVAEGVETSTQLRLLREQGCQSVQGYLVGKPMPETETRRLFADDTATAAAEPG